MLPDLPTARDWLRRDAADSIYARWLFLRLLGVCFLVAFFSFMLQADGLIGPRGLYPIPETLDLWRRLSPSPRFDFPTLFWLDPSAASLRAHCALGILLAALLVFNIAPALCCAALTFLYLSLCNGDQIFLSYQWDVLLIEAGFLAVFLAPWRLWPCLKTEPPPPWPALWLLRFLFFRLYFMSGVGKLTSGDPAWRGLTAMAHHYETQPLPTWLGWYAHQLPAGFQTFSTLMVFFIEIMLPFFIFAPRAVRRFAFAFAILLQGLIELTGNYAFFNLLTLALCFLLLDDTWLATTGARTLRWRIGRRLAKYGREAGAAACPIARPHFIAAALAAALLFPPHLFLTLNAATNISIRPPLLEPLRVQLQQWRLIGNYGLFSIMTTRRIEILIEGSDDGLTWHEIPFKYKPGDPAKHPPFIAPHQPRLDWQMWFAPLGHHDSQQMIDRLIQAIREDRKEVTKLLAPTPFNAPPRHLRATAYEYKMTDKKTRRETHHWWQRAPLQFQE